MEKAVGLRYDGGSEAPRLVAKGSGVTALRIKAIAEKYGIPIVRRDEAVDPLFLLDIGDCISEELYEIVAQILVFIYGLQVRDEKTKSS